MQERCHLGGSQLTARLPIAHSRLSIGKHLVTSWGHDRHRARRGMYGVSVAWRLGRRGKAIATGWIVLSGAMTDAVTMPPGAAATVSFTSLGTLTVPGGAS